MTSIVLGTLVSHPITGIAGCCALAASGHAAAYPSPAMNSRRRIVISRFDRGSLSRRRSQGNGGPQPSPHA